MVSLKVLTPNNNNLNRQIVKNMESVLKSVKKRHHKKHRLRKMQKQIVQSEKPTTSPEAKQTNIKGFFITEHEINDENAGSKRKLGELSDIESIKKSLKKRRTGNKNDQPEVVQAQISDSNNTPKQRRRRKKLFELEVETVELIKSPTIAEKVENISHADIEKTIRPKRSCTNNIIYTEEVLPLDKDINSKTSKNGDNNTELNGTPKTNQAKELNSSIKKGGNDSDIKTTPRTGQAKELNTKSAKKGGNNTDVKTTPKTSQRKIIDLMPKKIVDKEITIENSEEEVAVINLTETTPEPKKLAPVFLKSLPKPAVDPETVKARQSFLMSDLPEKMRQDMEKKKQVQEENNERLLFHFPEVSHVQQITNPVKNCFLANQYENLFQINLDDYQQELKFNFKRFAPLTNELVEETVSHLLLKTETQKKAFVRALKTASETDFPSIFFYKLLSKKNKDNDSMCMQITDKFAPSKSDEFLFNLKAIAELKEYLENFSIDSNKNRDYDSDDDFSNSSEGMLANRLPTVILHGPCSTGKSSSVYALAKELNYNVIEINSSSKRNGLKILQELQEATQSHKVHVAKLNFNRKVLRKLEKQDKKTTIILIEDIDIIFGEDCGFLGAINQLMNLTKRPIILTTNDLKAPVLRKSLLNEPGNNFKFLKFKRPENKERCADYLQIMSIVNGFNFDKPYLMSLFESLNFDLRKTMLNLDIIGQTITEIKPVKIVRKSESDLQQIDYSSYSNSEQNEDEKGLLEELEQLSFCCANFSTSDRWTGHVDNSLQNDIFEEMVKLSKSNADVNGFKLKPLDPSVPQQETIYNVIDVSIRGSGCSMDVEPILRDICKQERNRKNDLRSSSKFYHYLLRDSVSDFENFGTTNQKKADEVFNNCIKTFES